MEKVEPEGRYLWEILVPTEMENTKGGVNPVRRRHHENWDKMVYKITGGLTIGKPSKGKWVSPTGRLFSERMIPVKIMCTKRQIEAIATLTANHYRQEAIFYYRVSDVVTVVNYLRNDKGKLFPVHEAFA